MSGSFVAEKSAIDESDGVASLWEQVDAAETVRQLSHTALEHQKALSEDTTASLIGFRGRRRPR